MNELIFYWHTETWLGTHWALTWPNGCANQLDEARAAIKFWWPLWHGAIRWFRRVPLLKYIFGLNYFNNIQTAKAWIFEWCFGILTYSIKPTELSWYYCLLQYFFQLNIQKDIFQILKHILTIITAFYQSMVSNSLVFWAKAGIFVFVIYWIWVILNEIWSFVTRWYFGYFGVNGIAIESCFFNNK